MGAQPMGPLPRLLGAPKLNAKQYQTSIGAGGGPVCCNAVLDGAPDAWQTKGRSHRDEEALKHELEGLEDVPGVNDLNR